MPNKKLHGFVHITIIIGIVVIAAAIIAGALFWINKSKNNPVPPGINTSRSPAYLNSSQPTPPLSKYKEPTYEGSIGSALYKDLQQKFGSDRFKMKVIDTGYLQKYNDDFLIYVPSKSSLMTLQNQKSGNDNIKNEDITAYISSYFNSKNPIKTTNGFDYKTYDTGNEQCGQSAINEWFCLYKNGDFNKSLSEEINFLKDLQKQGFNVKEKGIGEILIDGIYARAQIMYVGRNYGDVPLTSSPLLLKKVNGTWTILNDEDQPPSCKKLEQKGFTKADQKYAGCTDQY